MEKGPEIKKLIVKYRNRCHEMSLEHRRLSQAFSYKNSFFNVLNIGITAISAVLTTLSASEIFDNRTTGIVTAVLMFISSFINSFQQFSKYEKTAETHRTSYLRFNALYENIRNRLISKEINSEYLEWVCLEYDKILGDSPDTVDDYEPLSGSQNSGSSPRSTSTNISDEEIKQDIKNKYEFSRFYVDSLN